MRSGGGVCVFRSVVKGRECLTKIPRHPHFGRVINGCLMALERNEIFEGVFLGKFSAVDQAHEEITDLGATLGAIKQRILSVKNRFLERSFTNIVVQRGTWFTQKQGELVPVVLHVADGLTDAGIRFHQSVVYLLFHPLLQFFHQGLAFVLVEQESITGRQIFLPGDGVVAIYLAQHVKDEETLPGKVDRHFGEFSAAVGQAVGHDGFKFSACIARQRITHLNGRCQILGAFRDHVGKVFAGMLPTSNKQGDAPRIDGGHHARCENPGSRLFAFLRLSERAPQKPWARC